MKLTDKSLRPKIYIAIVIATIICILNLFFNLSKPINQLETSSTDQLIAFNSNVIQQVSANQVALETNSGDDQKPPQPEEKTYAQILIELEAEMAVPIETKPSEPQADSAPSSQGIETTSNQTPKQDPQIVEPPPVKKVTPPIDSPPVIPSAIIRPTSSPDANPSSRFDLVDNNLTDKPYLPTKADGCYRAKNAYIKTTKAKDKDGLLLKPISVMGLIKPNKEATVYVHRCIYDLAKALLEKYNSDQPKSKQLSFRGWRSHSQQISARIKRNCVKVDKDHPQFNYQLYNNPVSDCDIPVARPGTSNHQDGLALDFSCQQRSVTKHNCPEALKWLRCHAANYGFVELSSETWHWDYYTQIKNGRARLVNKC